MSFWHRGLYKRSAGSLFLIYSQIIELDFICIFYNNKFGYCDEFILLSIVINFFLTFMMKNNRIL